MKLIPNQVTQKIGRSILQTKKNSPHIFFALGVVGVVGSAVLACRSTLKLEEAVDEFKAEVQEVKEIGITEEHSEQEYYRDMGYVYGKSALRLAKLYGPPVIIGAASIALLAGSHAQLTRRNNALTITVATLAKAYDEYRERVRGEVGEDRELELYRGIETQKVEAGGKTEIVKVVNPSGVSPYARFFDEFSINWKKDPEMNRFFIQCQQNYANHLLNARGHVFLNEIYDMLGLERSQAGAVVGWVLDGEGDGYIDFGMFEVRNSRFVNQIERSILLDFNVDGVVYDKI